MTAITDKRTNYRLTIRAAFLGYVVQAIVNNFLPLLFVQLQREYGIPLGQITLFITINFAIQLIIDVASAPVIDRIGYRAAMLISNASVILGLALLAILPDATGHPFIGILIAVSIYAVGGGLQEVLVSPIVEACPTEHKEMTMSLLHSAYCWGHVAVVLLSTVFFALTGIGRWRMLALLWCLVPAVDFVLFTFVPIFYLGEDAEDGERKGFAALFSQRVFWIMMLMMLCAGASEQAVSQWASAFAEQGLGVSKQLGDLFGPLLFAVCMGASRTIYGVAGYRISLRKFMLLSVGLCITAYLMILWSPVPIVTLLACGMAGFAVGIFWPGTFSMAASGVKGGGTLMFAMLALAGDLGCSGGPTMAGAVMSAWGGNMSFGIGAAIVFPIWMGIGLLFISWRTSSPMR